MLGSYFYHQILRKCVIGFGTLFNNIEIRHTADDGTVQRMKVPLAYGPIQKFLAKIEQQPTLKGRQAITLPRMSFEMTGIRYDPSRKTTITQTFKTCGAGTTSGALRKVFMPVPYDVNFTLSIATKINDDALQIIEQILPYFQPSFNITINLISSIGEKRDIPIILDNIAFTDDYEGSFDTRRSIIYDLTFTAKTYLFGKIADDSSGLIKKVDVDYYADTNTVTAKRVQRYTATPRALKDYDGDETTALASKLTIQQTKLVVNDASGLSVDDYIVIGSENMQIRSISGTNVTVYRAVDGTSAVEHAAGSVINLITATDNDSIIVGDDFGFNETVSFFEDFKEYSPSQGEDI